MSSKSSSFKDEVEKHPVTVVLLAVLAGFLAGIGTYEGILRIAKLEVVPAGLTAHGPESEAGIVGTSEAAENGPEDGPISEIHLRKITCRYNQEDVAEVQRLVSQLDEGRRRDVLAHIPNNDWSGVAEDLVYGYDGQPDKQKLLLRYFPTAVQSLGSDSLPEPRFEF